MSAAFTWWMPDEVLMIHDRMLENHGGMRGVRDMGMLESALAKPQNRLHYAQAGHFELAASYAAGVIWNHPFIDGNKRTGFVLASGFLQINGFRFQADEVDAVVSTLSLAVREIGIKEYAAWLQRVSVVVAA